mgnify:CR=1 FL=1
MADGTNSTTAESITTSTATAAATSTEPKAALQTEPKEPTAKYTDDDVNKLINQKFAEWQKKKDAELDEAKKLAEMSAQQKAEHERDELQKQLDVLKGEQTKSALTKQARKMLEDQGINVSDDLVTMMIGKDAESTKASIDSFAKRFKEEVKKAVTDALKGNGPKTGNTSGNITKQEILAVKNRIERQKLINEHMDLFKS